VIRGREENDRQDLPIEFVSPHSAWSGVLKVGQASAPGTGLSPPRVNLMRDLQGFKKTNGVHQLLPAIVDANRPWHGQETLRGSSADQPLGRFMSQRQSWPVCGENEQQRHCGGGD
jgi:hypothetical protein